MSSFNSVALLSILIGVLSWFLYRRRAKVSSKGHRKLPPGPPTLPIIGNLHMLGPLPHRTLTELSKVYGPLMYLKLGNLPTMVVSSPSFAKLILKTHDAVFASRPKNDAVNKIADGSKGMAFAPFSPHWRNNKKFTTQELLTTAKINSFANMRREQIEERVKLIKVDADARVAVNLTSEVEKLVGIVTYKTLFGSSKDEKHELKPIVQEILSLIGAFNFADYIPFLKPFDVQGLYRRLKKLGKDIDKLFSEIINEHEQDARNGTMKDHTDFVDMMLASQKSSSPSKYKLSMEAIKALLFDIIVGSVDTTNTWVEWTFTEIMRHPRVMKRLQEELVTKVGLNRMVNEKDLPNLEYLEMVIKESFRLHPVTPLLVPRESMQDIELSGHFIPKKSRVLINIWAIGRDPSIWSNNAEEFVPERFMEKSVDIFGHDFVVLPFGYGRRMCPGMNLGLINVKLIVGQLMHCFNWELPNGMAPSELDMTETSGLASPKVKNLIVIPSYRLLC